MVDDSMQSCLFLSDVDSLSCNYFKQNKQLLIPSYMVGRSKKRFNHLRSKLSCAGRLAHSVDCFIGLLECPDLSRVFDCHKRLSGR